MNKISVFAQFMKRVGHAYRRKFVLSRRIQSASTGAAGDVVLPERKIVGNSVKRTLYHHAFAADDA